ncbi:alcohol dehydrogenase catalytic domain-containing protein [Neobacillus vireti]|uniref:alcohol dehydrogenase catalytic domain-containing protein n=1 Tax=Neobacillus vireti TaxID=220686 RepID=UPI002FFF81B4
MRGFAMLGKGQTGIIEKPDPIIMNPTDAIIKVTAVAPCTSGVHLVEHGSFQSMFGNFIGHEAVGIVQEVCSAVKDFKPGDRVANQTQVHTGTV